MGRIGNYGTKQKSLSKASGIYLSFSSNSNSLHAG